MLYITLTVEEWKMIAAATAQYGSTLLKDSHEHYLSEAAAKDLAGGGAWCLGMAEKIQSATSAKETITFCSETSNAVSDGSHSRGDYNPNCPTNW